MSFPADIISAAVAVDVVALPVLIAAGRIRVGDLPGPVADAAPAIASPQPDRPAQPAPASGNGLLRRVREPGTGYTVSKKRLAEQAAAGNGSENT